MSGHEIKLGIVGCGRIAETSHVPGFQAVPGVTIAALVDADAKRAKALAAAAGLGEAAIFTDYDAFLASDLDAVAICTPNHLHAPMTLKALERGLHVLCEKPIAGTLADADAMVAAAAEAGRVLQINQSLRYSPLFATLDRLVREGAIGEPQHVRCIRGGGAPPNKGWSPGADWFVSKAAQGGLLLDLGVHMADAIRWVAGDVTSVMGDTFARTEGMEVPDNVRALMRHANGCTSVLEMSWTFPAGAGRFEIHGTQGRLQTGLDGSDLELVTIRDGKPAVSKPAVPESMPDSFTCFAQAVRGEAPSPTPAELGRDVVAICLAIAESSERGERVAVPAPLYSPETVTA